MTNPLNVLLAWRTAIRQANKKLIVATGCFDIYHAGHANYLLEAAKFGDFLLVGINSDESIRKLKGPTRPINTQQARMEVLASVRFVDAVFIYENTKKFLESIQPDVWVKGADYTLETLDGEEKDTVLRYGGRIEFIPFKYDISTSKILIKI